MFKCHDCGNATEGVELTPGAKSALCPSCKERRDRGELPAHVTEDAKKLTPRRKAPKPAPADG